MAVMHRRARRHRRPTDSTETAPPGDDRRHERHLVVAIAGAGLLLRLGWWAVADPSPVSDFLGYRSIADRLVSNGEYTRFGEPSAWRAPGYPAFLALGMLVSRADRWLSLLNVGLSASVAPLTWLLARRLGIGRTTALAAAAVVAVLPTLVLLAPVLASENLQMPLLLLAWSLAIGGRGHWRSAAAGAVLGVAALVRPESLAFLVAVPVLARVGSDRWKPAIVRTGVVAAVALCVVAPWWVRNAIQVGPGTGLSSTGGANFYMAHRPSGYGFIGPELTPLAGMGEAEMSREGYRLGLRAVADEPSRLARTTVRGTYELVRAPRYAAYYGTRRTAPRGPYPPSTSSGVVAGARAAAQVGWWATAPLAVLGTGVLLRRHRRAALAVLALAATTWFTFCVVFWAMPRYRLAIEPVIALAAAAAVVAFGERVAARARPTPQG